MKQSDIDGIRAQLAEGLKTDEVALVTTFHAQRRRTDGKDQLVEVVVRDYGGGPYRFRVEAREVEDHSRGATFATGNGAATLEAALDLMHWYRLDD